MENLYFINFYFMISNHILYRRQKYDFGRYEDTHHIMTHAETLY